MQPSARRFEYWEKSYAALLGLGAAIDYALDCGMDALSLRIAELAAYARTGLEQIPGVLINDRGVRRSGIVTFTREGRAASDLVAHIKASGINVSLSTPDYSRRDFESHGVTGLVRVSPHAYNTTEEIDRLLVAVAAS